MGNWNLTIKGYGIHHNNLPGDADRVGVDAVTALRAAGSTVSKATLELTNADGSSFDPPNITDLINLEAQDTE
jgi:hypothetical protein